MKMNKNGKRNIINFIRIKFRIIRFLMRLLFSFVKDRKTRKKVRYILYLLDFKQMFHDFCSSLCFNTDNISSYSVLLIEPNICHGEFIGGFINYFQNLGYQTDVITTPEIMEKHPFCRMKDDKNRIYISQMPLMDLFFKQKKISKYKHVFLMSSLLPILYKSYENVFDFFPNLKKHPSLYVVEHNIGAIKSFKKDGAVFENHLFIHGYIPSSVLVSPILFDNIKYKEKYHDKAVFVMLVSEILNFYIPFEFIKAVKNLVAKSLSFKIVVIGSENSVVLDNEIKPYFSFAGSTDFSTMFKKIEEADFFLPLLDYKNQAHEHYISSDVSSLVQMIYAFAKIPVIDPYFTWFYKFNEDNSIITADLEKGMERAILMSNKEYTQKRNNLIFLSETLVKETEQNLREILSEK